MMKVIMKVIKKTGTRCAALALCAALTLSFASPAPGAQSSPGDIAARERVANELNAELSRLGSSGDPLEREAILKRIIEECAGVEEAEAAHWALSDLYLDSFPQPREKEARDVLEYFLKQYPNSRWRLQAKCRLLSLCDPKSDRAVQLRRELLADKSLPQALRTAIQADGR